MISFFFIGNYTTIKLNMFLSFLQMAEGCILSNLCISFCYKVEPKHVDVLVSLLRAKGILHTFDAMGIGVTSLALEMLASTRSLTTLILCGVPEIVDEKVEMVSFRNENKYSYVTKRKTKLRIRAYSF